MRILLKLFSSFNDTFNSDSIHSQQSLIRSGLAELILDTDSLDFALAGLCDYFADSASKAVEDVVVFDSDDLADLVDAILHAVNIERLNSVHIDDARVDALLSQFLGSGDRKAVIATSLPSLII